MRPLTDTVPKPLVEVRGKPLIVHHIDKFVAAGITEVVINVSYLAEKIKAALGDGSRFGCDIRYSYEPEPLESGGGLATASSLFSNDYFIWAAADIYSDIDYKDIVIHAREKTSFSENSCNIEFDLHCVLVPAVAGAPGGEFALDRENRLNEGEPRHTLANVALMKTARCQAWPRGERFKLLPRYRECVAEGRASGELFSGLWCNVTTMADVERLNTR